VLLAGLLANLAAVVKVGELQCNTPSR